MFTPPAIFARFKFFLWLNLLSLVCGANLAAALQKAPSSNQPPRQLQQVVVVASQTPKSIAAIPATVWYIDNKRLQQEIQAGKKLGAILAATIPGLDASSQGRTNHGQYLRGRPMLVMIDGVSLNSSRKVSRQLDSIDPANIEHVEVLSGASAVYGGDATGGIINIVTKKGHSQGITSEVALSSTSGFVAGDDRELGARAAINFASESTANRLSFAYSETKNAYDGKNKALVPDITQGSLLYNKSYDIIGSSQIKLDQQQELDLSLAYYLSEQDSRDGFYFGERLRFLRTPQLIGVKSGFKSDRQARTERYQFNLQYRHDNFLGHSFYQQLSLRQEDISFIPFIYGAYFAASRQKTTVFSLKSALRKQFGAVTLDYGIDAYSDQLETDKMIFDRAISSSTGGLVNKKFTTVGRYPKTDVASLAGFVQSEYALSTQLAVNAGFRYQYLNNKIGDFVADNQQTLIALGRGKSADAIPGGSNNYNVGLFNLSLLYKIDTLNHVFANISQGFELPDPAKFYGQGQYATANAQGHYRLLRGANVSGSRLKGIKTDSFEMGSRFGSNKLNGQASIYYSLSDGSIDFDRRTLLITQSEAKKRVYGLEAKLSYLPTDAVEIGAMAHLSDSKIKSAGQWQKPDIYTASPSKTGIWLGFHGNDMSALLQANTSHKISDKSSRSIKSYTTYDFSYAYQPTANSSLTAGVQNIFNHYYTTAWGERAKGYYGSYATPAMFDYKGRGRTFSIGYSQRF